VIEPSVLDLNASIWDTHKLLRRLIPANIDLIPVLHPELGQVEADPAQIQQILINLVVNARDAMPQGGKIRIETAEVVLDEEFATRYPDVRPGPYVMLLVSDTGEGMDAETLSHIFEPFFTTKKEGNGTGLGLSTTYGIVKQSGGHITVASVPGEGTTFSVYLPKMPLAAEPGPAILNSESSPHQSETILLVEDELALRKLMRLTLERRGYRVLEAKDGAEALSICEQNPAHIDLVVTDLVLPRMTGLQLRQAAAASRPNMRFLLISGYAEQIPGSPGQFARGNDFLEKPFLPVELTEKVRELLSETDQMHKRPGAISPASGLQASNPKTAHG
jgi:two-component system cell cycle sensor histidine kinase/response regulator CckA